MIKVTDEMIEAYDDAAWENPGELGGVSCADIRSGLAAVLAIVEGDYRLTCPASAEWDQGLVRCAKDPGHEGGHHGLTPNAGVSWI